MINRNWIREQNVLIIEQRETEKERRKERKNREKEEKVAMQEQREVEKYEDRSETKNRE